MIEKGSVSSPPYSGLSKSSKHKERNDSILLILLFWMLWSRMWFYLLLCGTLT